MDYAFYKKLYEPHAAFFRKRAWAVKTLRFLNYALTGGIAAAYFAFLIYLSAIGAWYEIALCAIIPFACLLAVTLLRSVFNRPRPYAKGGAGITPLFCKWHKSDKSFPSRHLAAATVIGIVSLPYLPILGIAVLICGALLSYIRFAAGLHYPTDLLAGMGIGALFGALLFLF
ncbi:MAG: phosphatase PAP2 family protein [Clostridia bacterium]|nr:phosphatase PAP2 family protein [Clostridia bacterium]